ncbi:fumarylacetoacetate hydrolase family protein [Guyparkeria hydrothermalis]|uniref:fumarylacetoacetate hydrolase family protein n=1 Tax=Guyparkeria hydrothermalis TaxID=923 RepID=UPI0020204F42|nr:fumarylacetoacetate hydrolase family protein [Guyparkeria hydrothermalis]MCL7743695.1 fumarylacetoacetate hydrolase family protein [Guyparkeria hydrothermalis]
MGGATVADLGAVSDEVPETMIALIEQWDDWSGSLERLAEQAPRRSLSDVRVEAPIPCPVRDIFCVGKNYADHVNEVKALGYGSIPSHPIVFSKATTTVNRPDGLVELSADPTETTDYEGELAVVIGKGGRYIDERDARDHVFGYTLINDVSARYLQGRHVQWFLGKSIDGYAPMGPVIVTEASAGNIRDWRLQTRVNGELRQDAVLDQMIFSVPEIIATISRYVTLQPGDIIATGTPSGVGAGHEPPIYLKQGDEVVVSCEAVGELRSCFV